MNFHRKEILAISDTNIGQNAIIAIPTKYGKLREKS